MARALLRRVACAGVILALAVATAPPIGAAGAAEPLAAGGAAPGRGWGSIIGCAACAVGAGAIAAGGPAAVMIAVNTPGSAMAAIACAGACYEAFQ